MKEQEVKTRKRFFTKKKTMIAMVAFTIGNLFALSAATFAWFALSTQTASTIQTFSGDLDISIDKVTAYKYVYPYHRNSNEFIDYDGVGAVKSYVVQDTTTDVTGNLSDTVTIALSVGNYQPYATSASDANIGPTKIHYETSQDFKYYLLGNSVFNGVTNNPWSTLTATCFARREAPAVGSPVTVSNVLVSTGAEFVLFDAYTINSTNCKYFSYTSITPETNKVSRFSLLESNRIKCLKSGLYNFTYRVDNSANRYLDIELASRSDNAIIGTNLVDPTKISIDYRGSVNKTLYPTMDSYLSTAIQEQKTMVVLDVQLTYQNKNPIDAGIRVVRDAQSAHSIYSFTGKYNTTDNYTYTGYVNQSNRNPLKASDFYAYYFIFAKDANAYASPADAWNAIHDLKTDYQVSSEYQYVKFKNDTSYDETIPSEECVLHPKTNADTAVVPASATNNVYHCYIGIEYDYERMRFFTNENRLGKTYYLDRDFGFYFTATQHSEVSPSPSSSSNLGSSSGGE